jgi:hypothetical protein
MKYRRTGPSPLVHVPMDGAERMVAMAEGNRGGWTVRANCVKGKHDLAATAGPSAGLPGVVFAEKQGG